MTDSNAFHPIKTVYSYLPFEVRRAIDSVTKVFPHDVYLSSVDGGLDHIHEPVIEKLVARWEDETTIGLDTFPYRYWTAGSEEGIREFLSALELKGIDDINVLDGEYEGYEAVAHTRGIRTRTWPMGHLARNVPRGWWFISQPSARDGNTLPDGIVYDICEAGHKVFLDLSYLGTTDPMIYRVDHPGIQAVALSFSKPFGLFYHRIGFLFSRMPIPALEANRWFKNVLSILIAERVIEQFGSHWPGATFKGQQQTIVSNISQASGIPLRSSNAFLLARMSVQEAAALGEAERKLVEPFRRADGYRFCLTPYFLQRDRDRGRLW